MAELIRYSTVEDVAKAAAEHAVEVLGFVIKARGTAVWALAGGTSPMLAYKMITTDYSTSIDWSKVTVVIGDERMVPLDHADSSWGVIMALFDESTELSKVVRITPDVTGTVIQAAEKYNHLVKDLGRFDLVWAGVGEDGHTLSLFPGNDAFTSIAEDRIIPVYNSPKPPAERLTLSIKALESVDSLTIFATGSSKASALREARLKCELPVAVGAKTVEDHGGDVRWLYDAAAWSD